LSIDMELIRNIINVILLIAAVLAGGYLVKFKRKLGHAKDLMVYLNDALTDDKISEQEWMGLFAILGTLLHDCPGKEPPSERKHQIYLVIAIIFLVALVLWYFFVHGW